MNDQPTKKTRKPDFVSEDGFGALWVNGDTANLSYKNADGTRTLTRFRKNVAPVTAAQ